MKIICVTDIHGYFDTLISILKELESETDLNLLKDGDLNSKHTLVINGDLFDRGPKNAEALEWVLRQENTVYNIGNHEFFALFPDSAEDFLSEEYFENSSKEGLYWKHIDEDLRHELLKSAAEGRLQAAFRGHKYIYSHAGVKNEDIESLNNNLQEAGKNLLEAYNESESAYRQTQKEILTVTDSGHGTEISSSYPELFDMNRDSEGNLSTGGVVWERFHHLDTDIPQVVGHTKGRFMENNGGSFNPQWRKNALNINTIRDYQKGLSPVAATIEDQENLEIFKFDRLIQ